MKTARPTWAIATSAPYDGRVTRASYDVGNYINGAVQPVTLATLYKDDIMYANFNIEDNQFIRMKMIADQNDPNVKMPTHVSIRLGQDGRQSYTGTLDYLSQRRPVDRYAERPRQSRK